MPAKRSASKPRLSVAQLEVVGQFNDYSFDYPNLTFEQVAKKVLGVRAFPYTPTGRKFRREAKAAFDRERAQRAE
jgi:hypothetical protein